MTRSAGWTVALAAVVVVMAATPGQAADDPGQAVFVSQSCSTCHAVPAAGIEAKIPSDKTKAPALPTAELPSDEWITGYLQKEVDKNGAMHTKKFTGTDEELVAMLGWLRGLASPAP